MEDFIKKYWLETLFSTIITGLTFAVKHLYKRLKDKDLEQKKKLAEEAKEQELIKEGVLAILHDRLYTVCQTCLDRGFIYVTELENLEHLYKGYSGLGGNGTGEIMYKRCKSLRIEPDYHYHREEES